MRYDELQDEIKNAMRAKDKPKLSILRQVHGEIKNIEVNERRDITDADVDAMLKRLIKQTKETLDGSIKAGNDQERTDTLTAQVAILESYLPKAGVGRRAGRAHRRGADRDGRVLQEGHGSRHGRPHPEDRRQLRQGGRRQGAGPEAGLAPLPRIKQEGAHDARLLSLRRLPCPVAIRGTAEAVKPKRFFIGRKGNPARRPRSLSSTCQESPFLTTSKLT